MHALLLVLSEAIGLYQVVVIASVVMSWLIAFGVVKRRDRPVAVIEETLFRLTEPALRPLRRALPNLGGVDISPVILLLILFFLKQLIEDNLGYAIGY